mmetsp:Transcript_17373/g.56468  ORF Transcript_17373/g.56468 Transcript_17373/m.56468 type:complete len:232 (-) Transcript_17373:88-783(-)
MAQPLDVHARLGRLADRPPPRRPARQQALAVGRSVSLEQVSHHLLVDLEVGAGEVELGAAQRLEEVLNRSWKHARVGRRPHHAVRLAGAGLAVGEDGAVVALKHGVDDAGDVPVRLSLRRPHWQHRVEGVARAAILGKRDGAAIVGEAEGWRGLLRRGLARARRPEAGDDLDGLASHLAPRAVLLQASSRAAAASARRPRRSASSELTWPSYDRMSSSRSAMSRRASWSSA